MRPMYCARGGCQTPPPKAFRSTSSLGQRDRHFRGKLSLAVILLLIRNIGYLLLVNGFTILVLHGSDSKLLSAALVHFASSWNAVGSGVEGLSQAQPRVCPGQGLSKPSHAPERGSW